MQAQKSLITPAAELSSSLVCAWWVAPDVDAATEDHKEVCWSVTDVVDQLQRQQQQRCTTTVFCKAVRG